MLSPQTISTCGRCVCGRWCSSFSWPSIRIGAAACKTYAGLIRRKYSNITWNINSTIYADSWLVSAWSVYGEFQQTGAKYENEGISLIKLDPAGRITMLSDYFKDTLSFSPSALIDRSTRGVSALV